MRPKLLALATLIFSFLLLPLMPAAAATNVEWNTWDEQITVHNSGALDLVETQQIHVLSGTIHFGTRDWVHPVTIQSVSAGQGSAGLGQLSQVNSDSQQPGTYYVSQSGNTTTLKYYLPNQANANDTFNVQINYTAQTPTSGLVDWAIVPGDQAFKINSSTARIHFADGGAPDPSQVRVNQSNAVVNGNGNDITIQSQGAILANQPFAIQIPISVGAAPAANGNTNSGGLVNNAGTATGTTSGINLGGNLLPILCIVGLLIIFGGGALLRNLVGGFLGGGRSGGSGGLLGGTGFGSGNSGGGIFGGGNSNASSGGARGFRPSANQDREAPNVGNDKNSGGGTTFGF